MRLEFWILGAMVAVSFLGLLAGKRTLSRTIAGEVLGYQLATAGLMVGIGVGLWRTRFLDELARRFPVSPSAQRETKQFQQERMTLLLGHCLVVPRASRSRGCG
jgi:hypothetical protein